MFSFINFATVIVFLVTMFDDSTQLVTVPRSSPDPIAELCRALVVLKRTTDWLASKDESRFEELYTAYAAGLYAAQTEQLQNKNNNTQEV